MHLMFLCEHDGGLHALGRAAHDLERTQPLHLLGGIAA